MLVPLALLAVALGFVVLGSMQGQAASEGNGFALTVDTMTWMSNDMTGLGPGQATPPGFTMPDSQMPGMQPTGDNRLRVEIQLTNVTSIVQRYSMDDFGVSAPGGKSWKPNDPQATDTARSADLQPGFQATVDMYFDIPSANSKNLTLTWSRNGRTASMPVNTNGTGPSGMHM